MKMFWSVLLIKILFCFYNSLKICSSHDQLLIFTWFVIVIFYKQDSVLDGVLKQAYKTFKVTEKNVCGVCVCVGRGGGGRGCKSEP